MTDKISLAISKTINNEKIYLGNKYVFIDNKSKITNVIFSAVHQPHYMMISWFEKYTEYNYLYLNPIKCDYTDVDTLTKLILLCNSEKYNMIGFSFGGFAAIIYSSILPTSTLIIVDPHRNYCQAFININLEYYIPKINANVYYLRSLDNYDINEFKIISNLLEKTNIHYSIQCTLSDIHCGYIPGEDMIIHYIKFSEIISQNSNKIIKSNNINNVINHNYI
uniref:AB hydrolase-1 domain-containing protein n=1 Tax=viral metagenome TaxID=1070528 RepID=A0A6C0HW34_9ZZZZ